MTRSASTSSACLALLLSFLAGGCGDDDPFAAGKEGGPSLEGRYRAVRAVDPDDEDLLGQGWVVGARFFPLQDGDFYRLAMSPPDSLFSPGLFWEGTFQTGGGGEIVLIQQTEFGQQLLATGELEVVGEALVFDFGGNFVLDDLRLEPAPSPRPGQFTGGWNPVSVSVTDAEGNTTPLVPGDGSAPLNFTVEGRYNFVDFVVPAGEIFPNGDFFSYSGGWDLMADVILLDEAFGCNAFVGKVTGTSPFGIRGIGCDMRGKQLLIEATYERDETASSAS